MGITIYTTSTCPYCQMLEDFLKSKNITYTKKLVDNDVAAKDEMMSVSNGFLGVPYTIVTKSDGTKEGIIGFDQAKLSTVLAI